MQFGFVIDHTRCIGCHACTVACKSENSVPVGDFRTWVKYTEKGRFPEVKRSFAVLRCNHCTDAPCVTICPVNALEKRPDGIVDIDRDACIGCRACMQACPYDALALNADTGAVEKCHFCAHRVERRLAPACAVVCPTQAIQFGDLHDPDSPIARLVAENDTIVRRPEQNTGPNVRYLGVEPLALEPGVAVRPPTYLWSDRPNDKPEPWPDDLPLAPDTRTVLDVGHKVEWGWTVAAYLVTKGIAAGVGMLAPFVGLFGLTGAARDYAPEVIGLAFTAITTFLLVEDLARPKLFLRLLTRPNTRSWLVRGAWVLIAFSLALTASLALRLVGLDAAADELRWIAAPLGAGVAGYTAYLFAQCEGRDLWQSQLMLPHLLVSALACGAAVLVPFVGSPYGSGETVPLGLVLIPALVAFAAILFDELRGAQATSNARQAAAFLGSLRVRGVNAVGFSLLLAVLLPVAFGALFWPILPLFVISGVAIYEWAFIRAGQLPPLS